MYEQTYESTKLAYPVIPAEDWLQMIFVFPWDAFFCASAREYARVFRDGTKVAYGSTIGAGYTPLARVGGLAAWYQYPRIYAACEINQLPDPNDILNPAWEIDYSHAPSGAAAAFMDDVNQRYVHQFSANVLRIYDLRTGTVLSAINHGLNEYFKSLSWVTEGQVAGICASGKVRIFDYLSSTPAVLETGRIAAHSVAGYDCAFDCLAGIGADHKTRIYCREAWPYVLSNPTFEPAAVYGLKANAVQVRLTGQDGEPSPNWWIHWLLEDVDDGELGYLDKYVSKTDQDGYARNLYFGPDDGAVGQCKLKASVVLN